MPGHHVDFVAAKNMANQMISNVPWIKRVTGLDPIEFFFISAILFFVVYWLFFRDEDAEYTPVGEELTIEEWRRMFDPTYVRPDFSDPIPRQKGESKCRSIAERIMHASFKKVRPSWLRNPETNRCLELDCYNEDLKLAIEYSGSQHYHYTPHFHRSPADFENQVKRDRLKKELCQKAGVTLITVPYTVRYEEMEEYLRNKLTELGFIS